MYSHFRFILINHAALLQPEVSMIFCSVDMPQITPSAHIQMQKNPLLNKPHDLRTHSSLSQVMLI